MRISNALFISLCMILFGFFGASCTDRYCELENPDSGRGVPLQVATQVSEVAARSSIKTKFIPGDKMGLFLYNVDNSTLVSGGANFPSTYSVNNVWEQNFLLNDNKMKLYAYYPYEPTWSYPDIPFFIDEQIPLMYGTHAPNTTMYVNKDNAAAFLQMKYVLGIAEFFIKKSDYTGTGKVVKIEIRNNPASTNKPLPAEIMFDVVREDFKYIGDERSIILQDEKNGLGSQLTTTYPEDGVLAYVYTGKPVKTTGDLQVIFTIDGEERVWHMPVGTNWERNKKYSYFITISKGELHLDSVTIENLQPGGNDDINLK